eukprot:1155033-Pelagomonas_calceolata.AAC.5
MKLPATCMQRDRARKHIISQQSPYSDGVGGARGHLLPQLQIEGLQGTPGKHSNTEQQLRQGNVVQERVQCAPVDYPKVQLRPKTSFVFRDPRYLALRGPEVTHCIAQL